jgi:ApbE superfamily uncharacterized protein (UPF0280 family)
MTAPVLYGPRTYRTFEGSHRFKTFRVVVETSDLYVKAHSLLEKQTEELVRTCRAQIEAAIAARPEFLKSFEPLEENAEDAPVVLRMIRAGKTAGTGPMAAVAGAVAEYVGQALLQWSPEVIVENGGDIFLKVAEPVVVGILAGSSPFSGKIGIKVDSTPVALGICTSSATVGPSLSFGRADAATIVSKDVALADAVASGLGNRVKKPSDLRPAVEWALSVAGVEGALVVLEDRIAALGDIELVPVSEQTAEE